MCKQDRLRPLQVGITREHGLAVPSARSRSASFAVTIRGQMVDRVSQPQTQVSGDLIVAAAAGVQLPSGLTYLFHQPRLDKRMDIFGLLVKIIGRAVASSSIDCNPVQSVPLPPQSARPRFASPLQCAMLARMSDFKNPRSKENDELNFANDGSAAPVNLPPQSFLVQSHRALCP